MKTFHVEFHPVLPEDRNQGKHSYRWRGYFREFGFGRCSQRAAVRFGTVTSLLALSVGRVHVCDCWNNVHSPQCLTSTLGTTIRRLVEHPASPQPSKLSSLVAASPTVTISPQLLPFSNTDFNSNHFPPACIYLPSPSSCPTFIPTQSNSLFN